MHKQGALSRVVAFGAALALLGPGQASAAPATLLISKSISGASPLTAPACDYRPAHKDTETDGTLSVNPLDPDNILAVWTQDDSLSSVVATTFDGGETWEKALVPGLTRCTGGAYDEAFDPWISFGGDGTAYLAAVLWSGPVRYAIATSRSVDGGRTWSDATLLDETVIPFFLDKVTITGDPVREGVAYASWTLIVAAATTLSMVAVTRDGGETWSAPSPTGHVAAAGYVQFGSQIVVLPDGTLVHGFIEFQPAQLLLGPLAPTIVRAQRSTDGRTWSAPVVVGEISEVPVIDPETGDEYDGPWIVPQWASGPNGVVAVWRDIAPDASARIVLASSADGLSWNSTDVLSSPVQALKTAPAVGADGTVAVAFYDFRNDVPGDEQLTTDVWLRHSHDGVTWEETHLGGPFDFRLAPRTKDSYTPGGDYFGVVALPDGFATMFQMGAPAAVEGASDVFFARVAHE